MKCVSLQCGIRERARARLWHSILPGESKVSAPGLKFLGPARRFTRSRGYRLSSREVMPSSRREYQILPFLPLRPRAAILPDMARSYETVCRARSNMRVESVVEESDRREKFHRADFGARARENRRLSRAVLGENIDFHFHLAPFNTDEQRPPTASGIRHYLARLI